MAVPALCIAHHPGLHAYPRILPEALAPLHVALPFVQGPVSAAAANVAMLLLFGKLHTVLASQGAKAAAAKLFPQQLYRAAYVGVAGLHLAIIAVLWQPTPGAVVWRALPDRLALSPDTLFLVDAAVMGVSQLCILAVVARFGLLEFVGVSDLLAAPKGKGDGAHTPPERQASTVPLITSGLYRFARHPMYVFMMLGFLLTPVMSLDRLEVGATLALYLFWIGLPAEDAKLLQLFGEPYREYSKRVGPVCPLMWQPAPAASAASAAPAKSKHA